MRSNIRSRDGRGSVVRGSDIPVLIATLACLVLVLSPSQGGVNAWPSFNETTIAAASPFAGEMKEAIASPQQLVYNGCHEDDCQEKTIRVAYLGSSVLYYNDLPHLLGKLFEQAGYNYEEKNVLRSAGSFETTWQRNFDGIGAMTYLCPYRMAFGEAKFLDMLDDGPWDYLVMQDNTIGPAREETRLQAVQVLTEHYIPALAQAGVTPILFQTTSYRDGTGLEDFATTNTFFDSIREGYQLYQQEMNDAFLREWQKQPQNQQQALLQTKMAPVGQAFEDIAEFLPDLGFKLFQDNKHPSPYGTLLSAYLLYWEMTGEPPPDKPPPEDWYTTWRNIRQIPNFAFVFPTEQEALLIWIFAKQVYWEHHYNMIRRDQGF